MIAPISLGDFCRYALDVEEGQFVHDPVCLGSFFREYAGIQRTPSLRKTIDLVRSLGIDIEAVPYLETGGTNMMAKGRWHIHYSYKDRRPTQKYDIFHELFEVIHKNFDIISPGYGLLKEPQLSQHADRFAAATLIPPKFFLDQAGKTGCDLVKLSEDLELSHQCLIIALGQHFVEIPLIGVLYEHRPQGQNGSCPKITDFVATVVVKTGRARRIKELCGLQSVPVRNGHPNVGSLVCASITGGHPVLWRRTHIEDSPAILVRPLLSVGREPYRVILLAIPNEEYGMISSQVDKIEPRIVSGDTLCPSIAKCHNLDGCIWKASGGYHERGI